MTRYIVYLKDPSTHKTQIVANVSSKPKAEEIKKIYPVAYIKAIGTRKKKRKRQ